jgi:hypothetical protein
VAVRGAPADLADDADLTGSPTGSPPRRRPAGQQRGLHLPGDFLDAAPADLRRQLDVNVTTVMLLPRRCPA